MAYPDWAAGMKITAGRLRAMQPIVAIKTANQSSPTNNTALVDATGLSIDLEANAVYLLDGLLFWRGDVNFDIKFAFTYPTGSILDWAIVGGPAHDDSAYAVGNPTGNVRARVFAAAAQDAAQPYSATGSGVDLGGRLTGRIATGATAGVLQMRFGQNTSGATAAVLQARSWISAQRV